MATVSLPYNLQPGDPENVNQLRDNLNALVTGVNTIDTAQISTGAITSAKLASDVVPIGMIVPYAGSVTSIPTAWGTADPYKWLVCDGSEKAVASYADLDSTINTLYGTRTNGSGGSGTSHFRLPDLRGRVLVMKGTHADVDTLGDNEGLATADLARRSPKHQHTVYDPGHTHLVDLGIIATVNAGATVNLAGIQGSGTGTSSTTTGVKVNPQNTATSTSPVDTPAYIVVNYLIRAS